MDILNGKTGQVPKRLIKKFFNETTELGKELSLYNMLVETRVTDSEKADYIIDATSQMRKQLDNDKILVEKYKLIKEITNQYDLKDFFNIKLNNYKLFASIYKLFEYDINTTSPAELITSRFFLKETLLSENEDHKLEKKYLKDFLNEDSDIRHLVYSSLVKDLNENYASKLSPKQLNILNLYMKLNTNEVVFKDKINTEIDYLIKETLSKLKYITDDVLKIKINTVVRSTEKIKNVKILNENHIITVMRFYDFLSSLNKIK